jgi:nucleotide-binding universal stress UspA family protein
LKAAATERRDTMFDDVLVPIDGSDCAAAAVEYANDLASRRDATVHVLSVADSRTLEDAPQYQEVKDSRAELAEATCATLAEDDVEARAAVRTGVPHRAILDYVDQQGIDLVVMGTHGRTGVERYVLGSVTEKLVRLSDAPVLSVKAADDGAVSFPYEDVLVPTDGSEGANTAIEPAFEVAETYDARVHALSVIDTASMGLDVRSELIVEQLEDEARDAVDVVADRAEDRSLGPVATAVEYGSPYQEIGSYVEENDVDLVVMGTHGRSGIERYLLGSVAEKTVRTSSVPVMTVREPVDACGE